MSTSSVPLCFGLSTASQVFTSLCSGFGVGALEGRAPSSLPGRLAGHCRVKGPSVAALGSGSPFVQGFGDHCQLGEVRPPAVLLCPVFGDADRHVSREDVPFGSSSGSLSGSGDFFSSFSAASTTHVAAGVRPLGLSGVFSPSRSLTDASFVMAPQGSLIPHGGRPGHSDSSVTGVSRGSLLVVPGGQMGVWCPSPGSFSVTVAAY